MSTDKRVKVAPNPARATRLRWLAARLADETFDWEGLDWLDVVSALKDFAEVLESKPKKMGTPRRRFQQEEKFLRLSCLYFNEQTPGWQEKKGHAEADRTVAKLTGWRIPKRTRDYTAREAKEHARQLSLTPDDLLTAKLLVALEAPKEVQVAVRAALGLRNK